MNILKIGGTLFLAYEGRMGRASVKIKSDTILLHISDYKITT